MMYRVMVMFDPAQCVATPLNSVTQQPLPSYERSWLPVTQGQPGAGDGGLTSAQGTQLHSSLLISERKINYTLQNNANHHIT